MAEGNWLDLGGTGHSQRVEVLELSSCPTLTNGVAVWCGRLAIPAGMHLDAGTKNKLTLQGMGSGFVWILEKTDKEVTFCGTFS